LCVPVIDVDIALKTSIQAVILILMTEIDTA